MSDALICPKCSYERKPSDQGSPAQCVSCGLVFAKYVARPQAASNTSPKASGPARRSSPKHFTVLGQPIWLVALMCSLTFAMAWAYGSWSSKSKSESNSAPIYDAFAAQFACEGFVKDRLKAPSTAQFAPFRELAISGNGVGPWIVRGYVDAQNSFGANLRSNFSCTIEFVGNQAKLIEASVQ